MRLEYAGCSECGPVREHNEDAMLMCANEEAGLFLVADGVGGRSSGEVVSGRIRDTYRQWWQRAFLLPQGKADFLTLLERLKESLLHLNRELVQEFGQMNAGSTLALLFLYKGNFACVSLGDSRIYRARGLSVKQLTKDDAFRATGAANAKQDGKLTSAVGIRTSLEFNVHTEAIRKRERFFLCSDGVYRYTRPSVLRRALVFSALSRPEKTLRRLEREVLKNGAGDNYSGILVKVRL